MDPPLETWIASHPDLVAIEYHTSFPYAGDPFYQANLPEQLNRVYYYPISFVPSIRLDGPHAPPQNDPSGYESLYQQRKSVPARARIEFAGAYDSGARSGQVTARVIAGESMPGDWRLRIAVTESDIQYAAPNGINLHHHVFRRFVPDTTGTAMAFAAPFPDTAAVTLPFALDAAWTAQNVDLVAFLQEQGSREIEQGAILMVPDLPVVAVGDGGSPAAPARDRLEPVRPNPFNPSVRIAFELARDGRVAVSVLDPAGRTVRVLIAGAALPAGRHAVEWDGRDASGRAVGSGVYLVRLDGPSGGGVEKAVLIR